MEIPKFPTCNGGKVQPVAYLAFLLSLSSGFMQSPVGCDSFTQNRSFTILQKSWTPWNETYNRCLDVWVVLIPFSFRQLQKKYHSQATGQVHWKCLKWFVSNYVWGCVLYLPGDVIINSAVLQCHAEPQYTCKKKTKKTTCNSLITECRWDISISNLQSSTKKRREFSSFDTKNNFIV